jgi:hypothetical protein
VAGGAAAVTACAQAAEGISAAKAAPHNSLAATDKFFMMTDPQTLC